MSKNYLAQFRASKNTPATKAVPTFEQGGAAVPGGMPPGAEQVPGGAPTAGAGDPMQALADLAAQFAQNNDPQLAIQIAQMVVQLLGASGGGDPAAAGGAPAGAAPADPAAGGAPMARNGMALRVFKKGGKAPKA